MILGLPPSPELSNILKLYGHNFSFQFFRRGRGGKEGNTAGGHSAPRGVNYFLENQGEKLLVYLLVHPFPCLTLLKNIDKIKKKLFT
jgi:hypothetical protein